MASLYFANKRAEQNLATNGNERSGNQTTLENEPEPPSRHESTASSDVLSMSHIGRPPQDNHHEPSPPPQTNHDSVSSDLTQETGNVSALPDHTFSHTGEMSNGIHTEDVSEMENYREENPNLQRSQPPPSENDEKEGVGDKNRRLPLLICLCAFLLIIAGGAGAGVGVILSKRSSNSNSSDNIVPTAQPTVNKEKPTTPPKTEAPVVPTTSNEPTVPSAPVAAPMNSLCSSATVLDLSTVIFGSSAGGSVESSGTACGRLGEDGPGVWYQVAGQGSAITFSTCGDTKFDTKLAVFQGDCSGSTEDLVCVTFNDDAADGSCGTLSRSTWFGEIGVTYHVQVFGFRQQSGDFELSVSSESVPNDFCEDAMNIVPGTGFAEGSTVVATVDSTAGRCNGIDVSSPGVWYKVDGTGGSLVASTCHQLSFDTKLSVYSGGCDELVCVASDDDGCSSEVTNKASRVQFDTQAGVTYYILVHGYQSETGQFNLYVSRPEEYYNDFCEDARKAPLDQFLLGNNTLAKVDFNTGVSCPNTVAITGPTVWYSVIGTGGTITASLCSVQTQFDSLMSVFEGTCDNLVCVDGNDDSVREECGFTSEVSWESKPFQLYLVAVHGYQNATGEFGFEAKTTGQPTIFDTCSTAGGPLPLNYDIPLYLSDSANVGFSISKCTGIGGSAVVQGVWAFVVADGGTITASVCDGSPPGTSIFVFSGTCNSLFCINPGATSCEDSFPSNPNQSYRIFIQGSGEGDYSLSLSSTGPPPAENDACVGAIDVEINSEQLFGSTQNANVDEIPGQFCGETVTAPGVWYRIVGNGDPVTVGLCAGTDFDTRLSVFRGDCDNLVCIGGNDDFCSLQSAYEWDSEEGVPYYVLVHGFESLTGRFGLRVIS